MAKEALKKELVKRQGGKCKLSGRKLSGNVTALFDTDRELPKAEGGIYTLENTRAVDPVAHMERHGNLRIRDERLEHLKSVVDDRNHVMKLMLKANNQKLAALRRVDHLTEKTQGFLDALFEMMTYHMADRDKDLMRAVKELGEVDPLVNAAMGVKGVGPVTVAYLSVYVDLTKARHASSVWAYAGLDKPAMARYEKGVKGGGNKTLRTALYNMAVSQEKCRTAPYRIVYDRVKARLEMSELVVKTRIGKRSFGDEAGSGDETMDAVLDIDEGLEVCGAVKTHNTQGKTVECAWKDTKPCHRRGAALRAVMKHFLADYWFVGREILGLPTSPCYAEAMLGMSHKTINPIERGWKW